MNPTTNDHLTLAAEFPSASRADWVKLVEGVLKGVPFDKKLVSQTYDNVRIDPLYARAPNGGVVAGRAAGESWTVVQRIDQPDAAAASLQALDDLENGATGLALVFCGSVGAHGIGLPEGTYEHVARSLDGVVLDAGVVFDLAPVFGSADAGAAFADLVAARGTAPSAVRAHFNYEPLAAMAVRGYAPGSWPEVAAALARDVGTLKARGFAGPFLLADGRPVHDAGGSEIQELAFALASALAYLRALEGGGMPLESARDAIAFRLAADADQFLTMAKFRAIRKLWARVEQACGLLPKPVHVSAETAWRMLTKRDPYVNMLRATMATFAAGLGGANSITVLPHTLALGVPDGMARRAARNTQLILLEESNLARVTDPAAGSGGVEYLTAQLCDGAWALFQEIEKGGGCAAALESGLLATKIAAVQAARAANIAKRKDPLTGASEFPNIHEGPVSVLGGRLIGAAHGGEAKIKFTPIKPLRLAEPFEKLRDASDRALKTQGTRPKVFLANLGTAADFTARATFAKNFFEAGGIEAVGNDGYASVADMVAACMESQSVFACLCSSDEVYARDAIDAAKALATSGIKHLYLAGRPGERQGELTAAGVGTYVFAGSDVLATLNTAYEYLDIKPLT